MEEGRIRIVGFGKFIDDIKISPTPGFVLTQSSDTKDKSPHFSSGHSSFSWPASEHLPFLIRSHFLHGRRGENHPIQDFFKQLVSLQKHDARFKWILYGGICEKVCLFPTPEYTFLHVLPDQVPLCTSTVTLSSSHRDCLWSCWSPRGRRPLCLGGREMHDWIFVVLVLMVCHLYVVLPRTTGQFLEAPPSPQTYCFGFETRRPNCHSRAENEGEAGAGSGV